jgi:hypothetical protein
MHYGEGNTNGAQGHGHDVWRSAVLMGMEVDEESSLSVPEERSFFNDVNRNCTLNTVQASMDPSTHHVSLRRSSGGSRFAALFLLRLSYSILLPPMPRIPSPTLPRPRSLPLGVGGEGSHDRRLLLRSVLIGV